MLMPLQKVPLIALALPSQKIYKLAMFAVTWYYPALKRGYPVARRLKKICYHYMREAYSVKNG